MLDSSHSLHRGLYLTSVWTLFVWFVSLVSLHFAIKLLMFLWHCSQVLLWPHSASSSEISSDTQRLESVPFSYVIFCLYSNIINIWGPLPRYPTTEILIALIPIPMWPFTLRSTCKTSDLSLIYDHIGKWPKSDWKRSDSAWSANVSWVNYDTPVNIRFFLEWSSS